MKSSNPFDREIDPDVVVPADVTSKPEPPVRLLESMEDFKAHLALLPPQDIELLFKVIISEKDL
jgi:hypothetical protein